MLGWALNLGFGASTSDAPVVVSLPARALNARRGNIYGLAAALSGLLAVRWEG